MIFKFKYYSKKPCLPAGRLRSYQLQPCAGFTLIELIVSIGVFVLIMGFASLSYLNIQRSSDLANQTTQLISSLRQAQALAMSGQTQDSQNNVSVGVHFESNRYVIFIGSDYNESDSDNIITNLPSNISITIDLPSNNLLFIAKTGEVLDFQNDHKVISILQTDGQQKNLTINKLGVVDINLTES